MRKHILRVKRLLTALLMVAVPLLRPGLSFAGVEARLGSDWYTDWGKPTSNFDNTATLNIVDPAQKSFIKFDLSTLPLGTTGTDVKKATLKLFVDKVTTNGSFEVKRVTGTWTEGSITHNTA